MKHGVYVNIKILLEKIFVRLYVTEICFQKLIRNGFDFIPR